MHPGPSMEEAVGEPHIARVKLQLFYRRRRLDRAVEPGAEALGGGNHVYILRRETEMGDAQFGKLIQLGGKIVIAVGQGLRTIDREKFLAV